MVLMDLDGKLEKEIFVVDWLVLIFSLDGLLVVVMLEFGFDLRFVSSSIRSFRRLRCLSESLVTGLSRLVFLSW